MGKLGSDPHCVQIKIGTNICEVIEQPSTAYKQFAAILSGFITTFFVVTGILASLYSIRMLARMQTRKVGFSVKCVHQPLAPSPFVNTSVRWPPGTFSC
jgi:hypothetical protein